MAAPGGYPVRSSGFPLGVAINVLTWICSGFFAYLIQGVLPQLHGFEDGFLVFAGEAHVQGTRIGEHFVIFRFQGLENGVKLTLPTIFGLAPKPGLPDDGIC
jgi:hypothetical protein